MHLLLNTAFDLLGNLCEAFQIQSLSPYHLSRCRCLYLTWNVTSTHYTSTLNSVLQDNYIIARHRSLENSALIFWRIIWSELLIM